MQNNEELALETCAKIAKDINMEMFPIVLEALTTARAEGYRQGAEAMREDAAREVDLYGDVPHRCRAAERVRNLPLTESPATSDARQEGERDMREVIRWEFNRHHNGRLMAEGAVVHAETYEEALTKAKEMFRRDDPRNSDTFTLQAAWKESRK